MTKRFDLIVIGAGAAGLTAVHTALGLGRRVLLVERARPGGECTWTGCIPSKALIALAHELHIARRHAQVTVDSAEVMGRVRAVRERIYAGETPEVLERAGATFITGNARLVDRSTVEVNGERFSGKRLLLATGSSPRIPPIDGLDAVDVLTNETFFEQPELPRSMTILGGGPVGIELAQALVRLDVAVTVVEMEPEILPHEEPAFAAAIRDQLAGEGVRFELGTRAQRVRRTTTGIALDGDRGGAVVTVEAERLLVALGRQPNVDGLGLDAVGVRTTEQGIGVNAALQTSVRGIYACGDVVGPYQFSHMANYQAKLATLNAIVPLLRRRASYRHVPWVLFTEPELARTGMTEAEARAAHGDTIRVYDYDFAQLDRARIMPGESGRIKLIVGRRGRVLGAHILGARAGEMIAEVQVIKSLGIPFGRLQRVIHPYPTYSDALRQIAQQVAIDNLLGHPLVRLLRGRGGRG